MGLSSLQQLQAFAYWHRRVLETKQGRLLWSLDAATEATLMQQAPLYFFAGGRTDLYAEVVLQGATRVDLSAQYCGEAFAKANPLSGRSTSAEGDFFNFYIRELAQRKPQLVSRCYLYLETDIGEEPVRKPAVFINLAGSMADELLPGVLAYRGRAAQHQPIAELLDRLQAWCSPWHFGFMESRRDKAVRLVLILKGGLRNLPKVLRLSGVPPLQECWQQFLEEIDELQIFRYMLDLDALADGSVGTTVGIELLPMNAIVPARQQQLLRTTEYDRLKKLLLREGLADERIEGLEDAVFTAAVDADTYIYSRLSHFKLRWQNGRALPAKAYVQLRNVRRQSCINEAWGYIKVAEEAEVGKHE